MFMIFYETKRDLSAPAHEILRKTKCQFYLSAALLVRTSVFHKTGHSSMICQHTELHGLTLTGANSF
jgi:hypothetical protein